MIRRARRDGREARGKRKGAERGLRKGAERGLPFIEFSRSDLGAQVSKFGFYKLIEYIIKKICHGVKQNAKRCAIGETECNET